MAPFHPFLPPALWTLVHPADISRMADCATMKWIVLLCLLILAGCSAHKSTAECAHFFAGMRAAFERYDTNDDDRISLQEYRAVINSLQKPQPQREGPEKTDRDFETLDHDHNGYLSFGEFAGSHCGH